MMNYQNSFLTRYTNPDEEAQPSVANEDHNHQWGIVVKELEFKKSTSLKVSSNSNDEVDQLHEVALWMNSNIEEHTNKFQNLIEDKERLNDKYQDYKKCIAIIKQENAQLRGDKFRAEEQWKNTLEELEKLKKKYCEIECKKNTAEKLNETLQRNAKMNLRNVEQLNKTVSCKNETIKMIKRELDETTQKLSKREDVVTRLECQVTHLNKKLENLNEEYKEQVKLLDTVNMQVQNDFSKRQKEMNTMQSKIMEKERQLEENAVEIIKFKGIIKDLKIAKEEDRETTETYIKTLKSKNELLERELTIKVADSCKIQKEITALRKNANTHLKNTYMDLTQNKHGKIELNFEPKKTQLLEKEVNILNNN